MTKYIDFKGEIEADLPDVFRYKIKDLTDFEIHHKDTVIFIKFNLYENKFGEENHPLIWLTLGMINHNNLKEKKDDWKIKEKKLVLSPNNFFKLFKDMDFVLEKNFSKGL